MNFFVEEASEIYLDLRTTWFNSEIRRLVDFAEKEYIDDKFLYLDRYIEQRLLTLYTVEFFMSKVIEITVRIFSHYPRFGIRV